MSLQTDPPLCGFFHNKWSFGVVLTVCVILISGAVSCGCLQLPDGSRDDLPPEDAAFLNTSRELPMGGNWAVTCPAEIKSDYPTMYRIAEEQMGLYEIRIQVLSSMPVSVNFQEIKKETLLADEYGRTACEYEMKRAQALMEDNLTAEEELWEIENNAMDESLKHLALAKILYKSEYGII